MRLFGAGSNYIDCVVGNMEKMIDALLTSKRRTPDI
jgi:hypothetical protein